MNQLLGRTGMTRVLFLCLMAIATNAVLIQTVTTDDSMLKNGIRVAVLGVAAVAMFMHNSRLPVGIFLLIAFCVTLLAARQNTDQLSVIFVLVLVPAMFAVKERSLGKLFMVSAIFSLVLVFALLAAGITHNHVSELRGRSNFGTNGVPFFYNLVYGATTMLLVYVHKFKLRYRLVWTCAAVVLATYLFDLTDARGGYYAFLAFVGLLYTLPLLARLGLVRFITIALPVGFLGAAFYIAGLYGDGAANQLLSMRPILYQRFVENLTEADYFLSSSVKQYSQAVSIVDNSYLHLLVGGGFVVFLVFVFMFAQALRRLYRMGKFVDAAFLIASCIYFNSESILLRIENIFVIYFWYLVIRHSTPLFRERQGFSPARKHSASKVPPVPASVRVHRWAANPHGRSKQIPEWQRQEMLRTQRRDQRLLQSGPASPGRLPDWAGRPRR